MTCFILSHKPKELPSNLVSLYSYKRTFPACMISKRRAWWDRWVSNPRHLDFQSNALPSGLPSHIPLLVRAANSLSRLFIHDCGVDMAYFSCSTEACWVLFFMKAQRFEHAKVALRITTCRVLNAPPKHSSTISQIPYLYTALKA